MRVRLAWRDLIPPGAAPARDPLSWDLSRAGPAARSGPRRRLGDPWVLGAGTSTPSPKRGAPPAGDVSREGEESNRGALVGDQDVERETLVAGRNRSRRGPDGSETRRAGRSGPRRFGGPRSGSGAKGFRSRGPVVTLSRACGQEARTSLTSKTLFFRLGWGSSCAAEQIPARTRQCLTAAEEPGREEVRGWGLSPEGPLEGSPTRKSGLCPSRRSSDGSGVSSGLWG